MFLALSWVHIMLNQKFAHYDYHWRSSMSQTLRGLAKRRVRKLMHIVTPPPLKHVYNKPHLWLVRPELPFNIGFRLSWGLGWHISWNKPNYKFLNFIEILSFIMFQNQAPTQDAPTSFWFLLKYLSKRYQTSCLVHLWRYLKITLLR